MTVLNQNNSNQIKWLVFITLLVNAAAMLSPIINAGDSVLYATLSQHIAQSNDWANLVLDGKDWLDKPHFPFWITALFFKLGGVSAFTYILPGFLFHLVGGYFTYRIARLFYGRDTAWLALLVYVSVYHLMYTSSEVKAETYLTGSITAACYFWLRYDTVAKLKYLLLGALFSAFAVMTKGVFTLITIGSGLVCLWLYQKQWHKLWSGKWLLALVLSLLFTAPEVIALYLQFDSHPEKIMFGHANVSGIKFFLWDSQFGRFFNTGPIQNHEGNPWYFVHVFLWAFLPWVVVFAAAMVSGIRHFATVSTDNRASFVYLCGSFFITFALFSATSFQLDYYTVILFPFAAIICANYLTGWLKRQPSNRKLFVAQVGMTLLLLALVIGLSIYVSRPVLLAGVLALVAALSVYVYVTRMQMRIVATLFYPVMAINIVYLFMLSMTIFAYTSYSIPYNANKLLAGKPDVPVYVYQMDDIVAWELALYKHSQSYGIYDADKLPASGSHYFFIVKDEQLAQLRSQLGNFRQIAKEQWVDHKTGILPRLLRLAKGVEPLEMIDIVEVN